MGRIQKSDLRKNYLVANKLHVTRRRETRRFVDITNRTYTLCLYELEILRETIVGRNHVFKIRYTQFPVSIFTDKVCERLNSYLQESDLPEWTDSFSQIDYMEEVLYYLSMAAGKRSSIENMIFVHQADVTQIHGSVYEYDCFFGYLNKLCRKALFIIRKEIADPAMEAFAKQAHFQELEGKDLLFAGSLGNEVKARFRIRFV